MRITAFVVAVALTFPVVAVADDTAQPIANASSHIGATSWVDQKGHMDVGASYRLTKWSSLFRKGHYVEIDALVGKSTSGVGVYTDLWTEGQVTLLLGAGFVAPSIAGGKFTPMLGITVKMSGVK